MNEYSHDPVRVDHLSKEDEDILRNAVKQYYNTLKLTKDNPTFEDVVRLYMEKTDAKKADKNFHKLYRGWQLANLPSLKSDEYTTTYNYIFNNLDDADNIINSIAERHTDDNSGIRINEDLKGNAGNEERSLLNIWLSSKEIRIKNCRFLGLSAFVGIILGWYLKLPNNELIIKLAEFDSLWQRNMAVEYFKNKSPFFSSEYFNFNWGVFFLSTLLLFLILLFFNDVKFRQYLFEKITFSEEKKGKIPITYQDSDIIDINRLYRNVVIVFRKINLNLSIIPYVLLIIFLSFLSIGFIKSSFDALIDKESNLCILFLVMSLGLMILIHYVYKDYKNSKDD